MIDQDSQSQELLNSTQRSNMQEPTIPPNNEVPKTKRLSKLWPVVIIAIIFAGSALFLINQVFVSRNEPTPIPLITPIPQQSPIIEASPSSALVNAHNSFGFNVFQQLQPEEKDKNIFISPSSISLALSMVYNGSDGETKQAMAKTLQLENISIDDVNKSSSALISLLTNPDPKVQLAIANSIWSRKGETLSADFLETNKKYYLAKIESLDFADPKAADIINSWVSDNTKGKIPTIIDPPIPGDVVMYLINAVYFKGAWTQEFDKKLTQDRSFSLPDSSSKQIPMMQQKGTFPYFENDLFQAIQIPYGKNKQLAMYIFLPKGNLDSLTSQLNINNWQTWLNQYQEQEGTIILPKFKIEYKKNLNDVLSNLGMTVAFSDQADFSLMRENKLRDLYISEVIHKTYVDVNEEGTEAAAVTAVGIVGTTVMPEKKIFYMEVNKPFFFAIVDNKTKEILFMGQTSQP